MKSVLQNIQNQLTNKVPDLKYIDEDWGQLNIFQPPVQWPCCLIDISAADYSDIGIDRKKTPQNRQTGKVSVKLTVAKLKLTPSSGFSSQTQKDKSWEVWDLIQKIHQEIHGFSPDDNCSKMIRSKLERIIRDDGVQEFSLSYSFQVSDI